jgi:hypothetical protein
MATAAFALAARFLGGIDANDAMGPKQPKDETSTFSLPRLDFVTLKSQ